eukprot:TRINITY_DN66001_c0_g2_i1.p1 TRINITY_DN66001_c0_g2~~TRINITY_DN66001_c0_g2_i1.p1  ORF type:complete len:265 (+),score=19.61 TRINITY_DN66001_c0_g2_i1:1366-2160(+)
MKLVNYSMLRIPPIHAYTTVSQSSLLVVVLVLKVNPFGVHSPLQPFPGHLPVFVDRLSFKILFFSSTNRVFCGHILHQRPQVQGIGIVSFQTRDQFSFRVSKMGQTLLVVPMTDDGRASHYLLLKEAVQTLILFVDQGEEDVLGQRVEKVSQRQSRDSDSVFEHIQAEFTVKRRLLVKSFQEGDDVFIVIPDEEIFERRHPFFVPDALTVRLIFVADGCIFQLTEKRLFRREMGKVQFVQSSDEFVREKSFVFFHLKGSQVLRV